MSLPLARRARPAERHASSPNTDRDHAMLESSFTVGDFSAGHLRPYIVAEIGVNHEGDLDRAKRMIEAVARAGGHAAKFQTYKAELLATRATSPAYWDRSEEPADSQFGLFQRWDSFNDADYLSLSEHSRDCGIDFLSTPFDLGAVDSVAPLAPALKIASADITNVPLLRKVARQRKPVLLSVGASRLDEIAVAVQELTAHGAPQVALLHCVLNYPTPPQRAQLGQIPALLRLFGGDCAVGYSDHVKPDADGAMPALELAAALGAVVLEKHFTDDKAAAGNDHYHAMDANDLRRFVARLGQMRELYGSSVRDLRSEALAIANARRRIVAATGLAAAHTLGEDDLVALRSNVGIEIQHWDRVVGCTLRRAVAGGVPLDWADLQ
jgi:sialic acid synthase SpsE